MTTFTKRSQQRWMEVCELLSERDRQLISMVLMALATGAAMEDHAFTGDDLMELSRITVQGL